jgi:8-oxo-dGTP diphosphatase
MIEVVAAALENNQGQVLIAKRKEGKGLGGYWEFPGGKIEAGETPEEALQRELMEEMGVEVQVSDYLGESVYDYSDFTVKLMVFRGEIIRGDINLYTHQEYRWVEKEELPNYKFPPANQVIIDKLI